MWIIPPFNILEDSEFGLAMIGEAMSVYQLALKGGKEDFTFKALSKQSPTDPTDGLTPIYWIEAFQHMLAQR